MPDETSLYMRVRAVFDRPILDQRMIYIDLWSLVHLCTSLLLGYVLIRLLRPLWALATAIAVILAYEVFELALVDVLFAPETPVDTIWDIIIGFGGAFTTMRLTWWRKGKHPRKNSGNHHRSKSH